MPGVLHQGILALFRHDPWLPFDLRGLERPGSGPLVDRRAEVESLARALNQPVALPDLVMARAGSERGEGVVVCIEAQGKRDDRKRYAIPFYQAALAHEHQLPTYVVCVSFSSAMSRALERWSRGAPPRADVLVLDTQNVEVPSGIQAARARPTAAVLAGALHGFRGDLEAARLAVAATANLSEKRRMQYIRTILGALRKAHREQLEKEIPVEEYNPLWEIERQSSPYLYGVEEGRKQGQEEGRRQGREEGRRQVLVELIQTVAELRGLTLAERELARLEACDSLPQLRKWAKRAREVPSGAALFED